MWSVPWGTRTLRAVLVVPSVFALGYEGFGNLQLALFAAFGGFANLVVASFGGSWRDKAVAHLGLALTGSAAPGHRHGDQRDRRLAVLVTIPVTFGIFFAGVAGPNAASGVIAALFPFVLSVATPGTVSMIPDRLAGWWLASAASTVAVLVLSPPSPGDRLRAAAVGSARALAAALDAATGGTAIPADHEACQAAKHELISAFASTPYRPTGLATADQAMASVVQYLEWSTALLADATDGHPNLDRAAPPDRDLLAETAVVLAQADRRPAGRPRRERSAARSGRTGAAARGQCRLPPIGGRGRRRRLDADRRPARLPCPGDLARRPRARGGRPDRHPGAPIPRRSPPGAAAGTVPSRRGPRPNGGRPRCPARSVS